MEKKTLKKIEKAGNNTDTVVGHLTKGELIVPKVLFDIPEVKQMLQTLFKENNISLNEFIVGNSENKINMETGYPEFFFGKIISWGKKVLGGGGGGDKKKKPNNQNNQNNQAQQMQQQMAAQQAEYERQMKARADALAKAEEDARKAAEEEKKRREAQTQSDAARSMSLANQAQVATQIGNLSSPVSTPQAQRSAAGPQQVKQQAAESGTGYVPTQQFQGAAIAKSMNEESGGGNVPVNRFISPNTQGLTFGGA